MEDDGRLLFLGNVKRMTSFFFADERSNTSEVTRFLARDVFTDKRAHYRILKCKTNFKVRDRLREKRRQKN